MSRTTTILANFLGREEPAVELLREDGPFAQHLPGYKFRPQQAEVARTVTKCIRVRQPGLIEAGTGCGKSIGLLLPAILSGKKVIYATATRALQDQLRTKDLPTLAKALPNKFTWAVVKGRKNYVCVAKTDGLEDPEGPDEDMVRTRELLAWTRTTRTGDLAEFPHEIPADVQHQLVAQDDECPGRGCEFFEGCHYYGARQDAEDAQVTVTNHAMLVQHLLRGRLLPSNFEILIVDEAHKLEETVREALTKTMHARDARKAMAACMGLGRPGLDGPIQGVREFANFYRELRHWVAKKLAAGKDENETTLVLDPAKLDPFVRKQAEGYAAAIQVLLRELAQYNGTEAEVELWQAVLGPVRSLITEESNTVVWAELGERDSVTVYVAPVSIGGWLKSKLAGVIPIYASATLATKAGEKAFDFVREQLGANGALETLVNSPFDWTRQALYYLPVLELEEGWEKDHAAYARSIAPETERVLWATAGRAFVLFTSYAGMRATRRLVNTGLPTRMQGEASPRELLEWFRATRGAVLFATGAFWEGVDVPGQELSCVILDRLPFASPSDPIACARGRELGRGGAFWDDSLPRAVMRIKQGLGRLIRVELDRGLLCIMDQRLRTKAYGRNILEALPGAPLPGFNTLAPSSLAHVGKWLRPDTRAA